MASEFQLPQQSWTEQCEDGHTATHGSSVRSESSSVSKVDETASVDERHDPPVESVDDSQVDGVKMDSDQEHLQLSSNKQEVSNTEGEGVNDQSDPGLQKVEVVGGSVDSIYLDVGDSHAKQHKQEIRHQRRPTKVCYATYYNLWYVVSFMHICIK